MRTTASLSLTAILLALALSGCGGGGYPMRAESRYDDRKPYELTTEERMRLNRQLTRSQASGR